MKRNKVNEGNAFGAAVVKAREEGKTEFDFNGKTYKVRKEKKKSVNEGSIIKLNKQLSDEIIKSINMGYDEIKVGMISPKKKGVMLVNDKYQVRGTYPLELQNTIQSMINKITSESVIPKIRKMVREELQRINEGLTPTMATVGGVVYVDTDFVQQSNKFGSLEHAGMGNFYVRLKDGGTVWFDRANQSFDEFNGRVHKVSGDKDAVKFLLKAMKAKVVSESVRKLMEDVRPLHVIAREVAKDWKNVNYGAKPYLQAMGSLDSIKDRYGMDSADSIVRYFLSNATSWKGEVAKRVKAELKGMLK